MQIWIRLERIIHAEESNAARQRAALAFILAVVRGLRCTRLLDCGLLTHI
jgi:hypothetical protein